jgi:hypothetical protein
MLVSNLITMPVPDFSRIQKQSKMADTKKDSVAKPRKYLSVEGERFMVRMHKPSIGTYGTDVHRWFLTCGTGGLIKIFF